MTEQNDRTDAVLFAGGAYLGSVPYATASLEDLCSRSGLPLDRITSRFPTLHALGAAILEHERSSMHTIRDYVAMDSIDDPLVRLQKAFGAIGRLLAEDIVARAGIRLAVEAREHFPERRLNPFKTWESFVTTQLMCAQHAGRLRKGVDISAVSTLIVAAGMGTKDYITMHNRWEHAAEDLASTVGAVIDLIRIGQP